MDSPAAPVAEAFGGEIADSGYSFWSSGNGITLIGTAIGAAMAGLFAFLIWITRQWQEDRLDAKYLADTRPQQQSWGRMLRKKRGEAVAENEPDPEPPAPPPTRVQWLLGKGLEGLQCELERGAVLRKSCVNCRYASIGGPPACPHAFSCGVLRHPRGNVWHAAMRGLAWFSFTLVLVVIIGGVMAVIPAKPGSRPMSEVLVAALPALLGLALLASGIVFVWNLWNALVIRRQVREAAKAANQLGLEFLSFRRLSLDIGALAFPVVHPGEITDVHLAMHGRIDGRHLVVAYYEYEVAERDGPGSEIERKTAVVRGWMGKEIHVSWGQLVMMFPEPLDDLPSVLITPIKDIDFHLLRVSPPVTLRPGCQELSSHYCITGHPDAALLFGKDLRQFLMDHPGWNVQLMEGRLMVWHDKLDVLGAEIVPGKKERLASDIRTAVCLRELLEQRRMAIV